MAACSVAWATRYRPDLLEKLREATHGTVTDLELMKQAVKFNDFNLSLNELGTMLAFAQQKAKDTGQSVDYMVDSIVTGLGRKSLMILDNLGLSATEVKDKMKETGDMTKAVGAIIREQMAKAGDYVETAADRAAQANVSLQNKMEELGRKFAPIEEASNQLWTSMKIGILDVIDGPLMSLLNYLNQASKSAEDLLTGSLQEVGSNVDDKGNYIKRPAQKGAAGFDWEKGTWKPGYSGAIYNAATGQTELQEVLVTGTRREIPQKKPTKGVTKTQKTEEQLNNDEIQKLTQEYIKASDDRRKAIEGEIKTLQDRNKEIARLKDMALGKIGDDGSLSAMTQQLKELQNAQSESANGREWDDYQKKIDDVTEKINVLKGVLPKDQQATFTVEVNAEKLEQLRMLLPAEDETIRINVEEGRVNLPEIPKEDETIRVNITATTVDAMKEVRDMVGEIEGWQVEIEPKIEIKEEDLRTPFEKLRDNLKIEIAEENMQVDTTTLQTLMKTAIQNGIDGLDPNFSALQEKMREGMNIPDETWQALQDQINARLQELNIEPIKIDFKTGNIEKTGKETEKSWQAAAQAVQSVNSALQGLEEPGAKIMGIIGQAIAQIALGFAQATAADSKFGVLGWIAAITGGIATMTSTIAAIHSATGYANGGIVKGNSYSGDNIPAMIDGGAGGFAGLNAGEIVLNKSAQGNLASQLQDIEGRGGYTPSHISGEQIWIAINRYTKRTGRGELVTWK